MKKLFSDVLTFALSAVLAAGCMTAPCQSYAQESVQEEFCGDVYFDSVTFADLPEVLLNNNRYAYNYGYVLNEDQSKTYRFDANNAKAYEAFKDRIAPSESPIEIELPAPATVYDLTTPYQSQFTDDDLEKYCEVLFGACKYGIDSAFFDIPELFWIDPSNIHVQAEGRYVHNLSGTYNIKLTKITITPRAFKEFASMDDLNKYRAKLENAVNEFMPSGNTRYEKLKNLHDSIASFTYYDEYAKFSSSAIGSLVEPGVVCEGYSEGFKLICDRLDIPCVCVFGNYNAKTNIGHMWNYVQMEDGKWYVVDVTWDDLDGHNGEEVIGTYFLKGSASMSANHTPMSYGTTDFDYPVLSVEDFDPDAPIVTTSTTTTVITTTTTVTTDDIEGTTQTVTFTDEVSTTSHTQTGTTSSRTTATESTSTETETTSTVTDVTTTSTETTSTETTSTVTDTTTEETTSVTETDTTTTATDTTTTVTDTTTTVTDSTTTVSDTSTDDTTTTETETTSTDVTDTGTTTSVTVTDTETTTTSTDVTEETTTTTVTDTSSATSSSTTSGYDPFKVVYDRGDVNEDGIIDIADLVCCVNAALGRDVGDINCDLTGNGRVDAFDVICMRRIYIYS